MPTTRQMKTVRSHIADVIGRRYIEGDGDMCSCRYAPEGGGNVGVTYCHPPESGETVPFAELDETSKYELLTTYVGWDGFDFEQDAVVMRNVIDGKGDADWMSGIEPDEYWERMPQREGDSVGIDGDLFRFEGETPAIPAETRALFAEMMEDIALRKMPEDPTSPKTYDQQLQDAIDSGRFRNEDKERSR